MRSILALFLLVAVGFCDAATVEIGLGPPPPSFTTITGTATTSQLPKVNRLWLSDCSQHSHTGDTSETVLKTFSVSASSVTVPTNSIIIVRLIGTCTNSANNKVIRVRLGAAGAGTGGTQINSNTYTTSTSFARDVPIYCRGSSSQVSAPSGANQHEGAVAAALVTSAINLASDWEVSITGANANSGETTSIEACSLEIYSP